MTTEERERLMKPVVEVDGQEMNEGAERAPEERGVSRRTFVQVLGAGVLITVLPTTADAQRGGGGGGGGFAGNTQGLTVGARIHIAKDGTITVMCGKVECGQGARAEIAQVAAEELRVPATALQIILSDTGLVPDDGMTAGSRTTPATVPAVRQGAAAARKLLVDLAVAKWGVGPGEVEVSAGKVMHAASKRELSYADLATNDEQSKALETAIPGNMTLTPVSQWKVMGTSVMRPNRRDLVTGGHHYPADTVRPGMLYGKVLRAPSYGAKLVSVDLAPAKEMKDVVAVQEGTFVGVAGPTTAAAEMALLAISGTAKWESAEHPASKELYPYLMSKVRGGIPTNPFAADVEAGAKKLHHEYHVAYVQHCPMEPRAACAEWEGGKVTVWVGSQNPFGCRTELARALGIGAEMVRVIVPDFGGGFGGKHTPDVHIEAARLSKAAGKPVLVRWTREEELTWACFRPAGVIDIEASLDDKGTLTSWHYLNVLSGGAGLATPYRVAANKNRSQTVASDSPLRTSSYRGLAATANHFARESFMDELAAAAGMDPLAFRLAHLDNTQPAGARLRAVLETVAKAFDWETKVKKKDPSVGVGLACGTEKGSYTAACVEVGIKDGTISVKKVCQAFECGAIINPEGLLSQVQGAIIMGLGPALREEMRFDGGKVTNASFWRYLVPRFADVPELDIHLVNRLDLASEGAGETPIIVVAPAIANAVYHATGERVREMPIRLAKAPATTQG